jgi:hypothetical protein
MGKDFHFDKYFPFPQLGEDQQCSMIDIPNISFILYSKDTIKIWYSCISDRASCRPTWAMLPPPAIGSFPLDFDLLAV